MDYGELDGGLNALDVVRMQRNPDGTQAGFRVDSEQVEVTGALPYVWDDLRFPASGVSLGGFTVPATVDQVGYPGSLLFSPTAVNSIGGIAQMPHTWAKGTAIRPHIHWTKTTSAVGAVEWALSYAIANAGDTLGAYSASVIGTVAVADSDTANKHAIVSWPEIDMSAYRESAIIVWALIRNGPSAGDTYAANARLLEIDFHYRKNKDGTVLEFPL